MSATHVRVPLDRNAIRNYLWDVRIPQTTLLRLLDVTQATVLIWRKQEDFPVIRLSDWRIEFSTVAVRFWLRKYRPRQERSFIDRFHLWQSGKLAAPLEGRKKK